MPYIISGIIDRFEDKLAVIKTTEDTEILWPIKNLPDDLLAGDSVTITLSNDKDGTQDKTELAKNMLNDILNVQETNSGE